MQWPEEGIGRRKSDKQQVGDNFEIRTSNTPLSNEDSCVRVEVCLFSPKITKIFHAIFHNSRNSYFLEEFAVLLFGF